MSERGKAAVEVSLNVVEVFEAHGHADQALHHAGILALGFGEAAVRGAGGVGH